MIWAVAARVPAVAINIPGCAPHILVYDVQYVSSMQGKRPKKSWGLRTVYLRSIKKFVLRLLISI